MNSDSHCLPALKNSRRLNYPSSFSTYHDIICSAFPDCSSELDQSFLSHLLSIAVSVTRLHDHVTLVEASKMELKLWSQFFSSWKHISFFYDDHATKPEGIHLLTDAAPSTGFGGYHDSSHFSAKRHPDFATLIPSTAICEMCPSIIATILWGHDWSKSIITIYSYNSVAVDITNKERLHGLDVMQFMLRLTLVSAQHELIQGHETHC